MHLRLLPILTALWVVSVTCLPQGMNLPKRQGPPAPPGPNTCKAGSPPAGGRFWNERHAQTPDRLFPDRKTSDIGFIIGIKTDTGYTGRFQVYFNLDTGVVIGASALLDKGGLTIDPDSTGGASVKSQADHTTTYEIWVDSPRQTTRQIAPGQPDYQFEGMFPRVEMVVNRDPTNPYDVISWQNFRQGATDVGALPGHGDRCG
ncbi:hypothetical protein Ptr902_12649 [Pyrenophora tritici-repentis]|nr:hypothetical protein L13192_07991 [Pyrenophora tritici-repentis]KAI2476010.1 hypothetical protein Ptr902_12649 [Pyrenophora tritici-repentis]